MNDSGKFLTNHRGKYARLLILYFLLTACYAQVVPEATAADPIKISLAPLQHTMEAIAPHGLILTIKNQGNTPIGLSTGNTNPASDPVRANTIKLEVTHNHAGKTTIRTLSVPMFEPVGEFKSPVELYTLKVPAIAEIQPGHSYETTIYLDSATEFNKSYSPIAGNYTVRATLYPFQFKANGQRTDHELMSDPATFTISPPKTPDTQRTYHDSLHGWWEATTLTLTANGQFEYRTFSDMGGERPVVIGKYQETTDTIKLNATVNADTFGFQDHRTWKKVRVKNKWDTLILPKTAANLSPNELPTQYPILIPTTTSEATSTRTSKYPWHHTQ